MTPSVRLAWLRTWSMDSCSVPQSTTAMRIASRTKIVTAMRYLNDIAGYFSAKFRSCMA